MADPREIARIEPDVARREASERRALLVCAYDDRQRCRSIMLEGAIDMDELQARLPTLPKDAPLIFYCA